MSQTFVKLLEIGTRQLGLRARAPASWRHDCAHYVEPSRLSGQRLEVMSLVSHSDDSERRCPLCDPVVILSSKEWQTVQSSFRSSLWSAPLFLWRLVVGISFATERLRVVNLLV